jgi:hypothetical protein
LSPTSYIFQTAANVIRDRARRQAARHHREHDELSEGDLPTEMKGDSPKNPKDFKPDYEIGSRNVYADLGRAAASSGVTGLPLLEGDRGSEASGAVNSARAPTKPEGLRSAAFLLGRPFAASLGLTRTGSCEQF